LEESQQNYNRELAAHAAAVQSLNDTQQKHKALQEEFNQFKVITWKFFLVVTLISYNNFFN